MDVATSPGDALAQPSHTRLFALLGELRRPARTEGLAEHLATEAAEREMTAGEFRQP